MIIEKLAHDNKRLREVIEEAVAFWRSRSHSQAANEVLRKMEATLKETKP